MYPCNINKPIDFKTQSAAISRNFALRASKSVAFSRVVVLCAPTSAANSKIFVSVHLKVCALCTLRTKNSRKICLCNFRATFTY